MNEFFKNSRNLLENISTNTSTTGTNTGTNIKRFFKNIFKKQKHVIFNLENLNLNDEKKRQIEIRRNPTH